MASSPKAHPQQRRARSDDREAVGRDGVYIKHASQMVGVSAAVLRSWEAQGLIAPRRSESGFRVFSLADIERLRRIRDLVQGQGLNVAGVRRLLAEEDGGAPPPPAAAAEGNRAELGPRLRRLRAERGLSVRETAALSGLSASSISALERSLSRPSVGSLQKLAAALGTNLVRLMGGEDAAGDERLVVGEHHRQPLELEIEGVVIEQLSIGAAQLEPLLFRVAPGAGSDSYHHPGEEFLFMLEGEFELTLDETLTYRLVPGDAMTFASHRPHRWRNPGTEGAVVLWINTPPTF